LWVLFLGRIVDGASGGSLSVAQAAVADIAPEEQRPGLLGMLGAAFGIGFVLGPAIGGLGCARRAPMCRSTSPACSPPSTRSRPIIRLPETRPSRSSTSVPRGPRTPLSPILRHLAVIGFITVIAFTAFEATFSLFGDRRFGLTEASRRPCSSVSASFLVAVQGGLYGRLVDRYGLHRLFTLGLGMLVVGLAMMSVAFVWPC
jgi:MFS family permease